MISGTAIRRVVLLFYLSEILVKSIECLFLCVIIIKKDKRNEKM